MIIYHFDRVTGEYLGSQEYAPPKGVGLPAHSTEIGPPSYTANEVPVFKDGSWILFEDYRGSSCFDKSTREEVAIKDIGPIPDHITILPPQTDYDYWDDAAQGWITNNDAMTRANIISQIQTIEATITPRRMRDAILGVDGGWLATTEDEIKQLRGSL